MACNVLIWGLVLVGYNTRVLLATSEDDLLEYMSKEEREVLKFVFFSICIVNIKFLLLISMIMLYFIEKKQEICFITHITHIW